MPHFSARELITRTRATRGARHLDRTRPGWFREINSSELNLSHPVQCIIGQLYDGDYREGLTAEFVKGELTAEARDSDSTCADVILRQWGVAHGFHALYSSSQYRNSEYEYLTAAWRQLIIRWNKEDSDSG